MLTHDDELVDSNCFAPDPESDVLTDKCGEQATTYVILPSGVRRYICPDHAEDVDRFGEPPDDHPKVGVCERCRLLTPVELIDPEADVCVDCLE